MTMLSILDSDAHPQTISPLFTQLPTELRLMVYTLVFAGCRATAWINHVFGEYGEYDAYGKYVKIRDGRRKRRLLQERKKCCFQHFEGGFELLITCRMVYIEAFQAYWSETVLTMESNDRLRLFGDGCTLQDVCAFLPAPIKANLRHLRNTNLPILERFRPTCNSPNWTPTLLREFPKLVSCAFRHNACSPGGLVRPYHLLSVADSENVARFYYGVGPFQVRNAESPAEYLESRIGVQQSCGVAILGVALSAKPRGCPNHYRRRRQYFNYTTGMVYQTTISQIDEDGFQEAIRAEEGSEWSRCYEVCD